LRIVMGWQGEGMVLFGLLGSGIRFFDKQISAVFSSLNSVLCSLLHSMAPPLLSIIFFTFLLDSSYVFPRGSSAMSLMKPRLSSPLHGLGSAILRTPEL
jgi:hypothetical protein